MANESTGELLRIEVLAREGASPPPLSSIAYFLNDLNLLYEFSRIIADPKYKEYRFSRFSLYRNRKRIDEVDQLKVKRLNHDSPLGVTGVVGFTAAGATALWLLTQSIERIANAGINRDILKLQREKLTRELRTAAPSEAPLPWGAADVEHELRRREADRLFERIVDHLRQNPIQIVQVNVTLETDRTIDDEAVLPFPQHKRNIILDDEE